MRYKIVIAYDGTGYSGWQVQPNALSIQEKLEEALYMMTQEKVRVIGSGRTDAGVHADAQAAHFTLTNELAPQKIKNSFNGILPNDIRILSVESVPDVFHAQKSAVGKCYHYHITLGDVCPPFLHRTSWHIRYPFDTKALKTAASQFVGEKDFSSFANEQFKGACGKNPVRHVYRLDIVETKWGIRLEFEGNGFLYKMVRNIVGTLVAVGKMKLASEKIPELFALKDRKKTPLAAPAKGLFLHTVHYLEKTSSKE